MAWGAAAALFVGGVIGSVTKDWLHDTILKRIEGEPTTKVTIGELAIATHVKRGDYLRIVQHRSHVPQSQADGFVLSADTEIQGYKGKELKVTASILSKTNNPVAETAPPVPRYIRPASDDDSENPDVWLPAPPARGSYQVQVIIWSNQRRVTSRSQVFTFD